MEDRKLNSQESIELIARMLRNTQDNLQKNAGIHSLIWGYTTLAVSLSVYFSLRATHDLHSHLLWLAIPVVGLLLELFTRRWWAAPEVRTFLDRATTSLWFPLGVALLLFPYLGQGVDAMSLVLLLVSLGMAQTGFIARYTLFTVIGLLGLAVSLGMTYIGGEEKILIFAAGIVAVLIVPGHTLNRKAAKNHVQGA